MVFMAISGLFLYVLLLHKQWKLQQKCLILFVDLTHLCRLRRYCQGWVCWELQNDEESVTADR